MNRSELIAELALRIDAPKAMATRAVAALFNPESGIISGELRDGGEVRLLGFGKFSTASREARTVTSFGVEMQLDPAKTSVKFKAGKGLADAVNGT